MSHLGRLPPLPAALPPPHRSVWRLFPWAIAASLFLVIAVNAWMIWAALSTFPGAAGMDGFDISNEYDRILAAEQRQDRLGWTLTVETDGRRPVLRLLDAQGRGLAGIVVTGVAERPLGPLYQTALIFHPTADGTLVADVALPLPGQWDLVLQAASGRHRFRATRRVIAR